MARPLVMVVFGTRPEAIKLAPVVDALRRRGLRVRVVSSGQHGHLLKPLLGELRIKADRDLRLMRPGQTVDMLLERAVKALGTELARTRPGLVIVQGDTTTAAAASLAAYQAGVLVAHVEAGLRTFDPTNPFPEELNRVAIDEVADLRFAPTPEAARNLRDGRHVEVTGNTVVDALKRALARKRPPRDAGLRRVLRSLKPGETLALATAHRRESQGGEIAGFVRAFVTLLEGYPSLRIVLPIHPSPKVAAAVRRGGSHPRLHLLKPLGYADTVETLRRCRLVLTDSGGLVEEAAVLGRPTLILRRRTERREAVKAGVAFLAGTDPRRIVSLASRLLQDPSFYKKAARPAGVFGDGKAADRIARAVGAALTRGGGN